MTVMVFYIIFWFSTDLIYIYIRYIYYNIISYIYFFAPRHVPSTSGILQAWCLLAPFAFDSTTRNLWNMRIDGGFEGIFNFFQLHNLSYRCFCPFCFSLQSGHSTLIRFWRIASRHQGKIKYLHIFLCTLHFWDMPHIGAYTVFCVVFFEASLERCKENLLLVCFVCYLSPCYSNQLSKL